MSKRKRVEEKLEKKLWDPKELRLYLETMTTFQ